MNQNSKEKSLVSKFLIPSLFIANFSLFIVDLVTQIFLRDVSRTFFGSIDDAFLAITGQLVTVSSGVSFVIALFLGFLSVKYNSKKLLVLGLLCIPIGTLGCSLAPNFIFMQIFYAIEGIGTTVTGVMTLVLVGEILPLNKKPQTLAWISLGGSLPGLLGNLAISFFFQTGDWRSFLLWFAFPISLVALVAVYFTVPLLPQKRLKDMGKVAYLNAFKQIFKNKSATACLIGIIVRVASLSWTVYYLTFFRVELGFDIQLAALIAFGVILVMTLGRLISGYLIPKVGRKRLPLITMVIEGATLPLIAFVPELWIALVILFSISFIGAFTDHSLANLSLEQVPESRGTMMSLHFAVVWLGATIGAGIGGFVLYLGFGFTGIFLVFSAITFVAVSIFFFFVKDPCVIMAPESTKSKSS